MTRIRHIFRTREEVIERWYDQTQDRAQTPQKRIYFEGDMLYSYGPHFPMAKRYSASKVLVTSREYFVTWEDRQKLSWPPAGRNGPRNQPSMGTERQKHEVIKFLWNQRGVQPIRIDRVCVEGPEDHKHNVFTAMDRMLETAQKNQRARLQSYLWKIGELAGDLLQYMSVFGLSRDSKTGRLLQGLSSEVFARLVGITHRQALDLEKLKNDRQVLANARAIVRQEARSAR